MMAFKERVTDLIPANEAELEEELNYQLIAVGKDGMEHRVEFINQTPQRILDGLPVAFTNLWGITHPEAHERRTVQLRIIAAGLIV